MSFSSTLPNFRLCFLLLLSLYTCKHRAYKIRHKFLKGLCHPTIYTPFSLTLHHSPLQPLPNTLPYNGELLVVPWILHSYSRLSSFVFIIPSIPSASYPSLPGEIPALSRLSSSLSRPSSILLLYEASPDPLCTRPNWLFFLCGLLYTVEIFK